MNSTLATVKRLASHLTTIKTDSGDYRTVFTQESLADTNEPYHQALSNLFYSACVSVDTAYNWTADYLDFLADNQDKKDLDELAHEFAVDVDVYTSDLTNWLAIDPKHVDYLTQALEEGEPKSGADALTSAQYFARYELAELLNRKILLLASNQHDDEPAGSQPCPDCFATDGQHVRASCTE